MKRYEDFNNTFKENKSAERQSFEMIVAYLEEIYGVNLDWCREKYENQLEWLREENKK
ncbi:MAG: hypothetical protein QME45_04245 [Clostridiales bacterium]|nr:hypothetical protein [Clostridiales bacterium]